MKIDLEFEIGQDVYRIVRKIVAGKTCWGVHCTYIDYAKVTKTGVSYHCFNRSGRSIYGNKIVYGDRQEADRAAAEMNLKDWKERKDL